MAQTFYALFPRVDVRPLTDGLAAVFNAEETDARRYFEVTRIAVRPASGWAAANGTTMPAAKCALYRITAMTGGATVDAVKRDTGSADLPAEVSCVTFPDSVTVSGAPLRSLADAPALTGTTGTNMWTSARVYGGALSPYLRANQADVLRFQGNSTIERIVLREGEGVAVVLTAHGWPRAGQINFTVVNQSTRETYQFRSRDIGHPYLTDSAMIGILNGSGSGVVLEVNAAEFPNDGESNYPVFRLAKIARATDGDAVTPIAADTDNAVPEALVCTGGDFDSGLYGSGQGVQFDWQTTHGATFSITQQQNVATLRRLSGVHPFNTVGVTPGLRVGQEDVELYCAPAGSGIVLRPQEGLALLAGRAGVIESSTFAYFDVEATILHYPPPSSVGGGNTYSRSRVVNAGAV